MQDPAQEFNTGYSPEDRDMMSEAHEADEPHVKGQLVAEMDRVIQRRNRPSRSPSETDSEDRFWSRVSIVDDETSCWEWIAGCFPDGYGSVVIDGRKRGAHRVAYERTYGKIPSGLCVLHRCDNPPCVRPAHLFLGTHADNAADRGQKGRTARGDASGARLHPERLKPATGAAHGARLHPERLARGTANGAARLNEHVVRKIRHLYITGGWTQADLGRQFGVSRSTISLVIRGLTWAHVS